MRPRGRPSLQRLADAAIVIVVALFTAAIASGAENVGWAWTALGVVAALAAGVSLWWRRTFPVRVLAIAVVCCTINEVLTPEVLFPYAALFALSSVAAARHPKVSLPSLAAVAAVTALDYGQTAAGDVSFAIAIAVATWALGEALRNRRQAIAESARRAVSEEQGRIARELHDVLAHNITVIVVQAAAADDVFDSHPDQARSALQSIEASARGALADLRGVLQGVRNEERPWMVRLDELAQPKAGLTVEVHHEGPQLPLPEQLDLSAFRIIQEALTNVLRHARATRADVTVRQQSDLLEVDVLDDGVGGLSQLPGGGRGIEGMRERAALLGGTLEATALPTGGFRVSARLPVGVAR
jgi:signal transduction histidine kinase